MHEGGLGWMWLSLKWWVLVEMSQTACVLRQRTNRLVRFFLWRSRSCWTCFHQTLETKGWITWTCQVFRPPITSFKCYRCTSWVAAQECRKVCLLKIRQNYIYSVVIFSKTENLCSPSELYIKKPNTSPGILLHGNLISVQSGSCYVIVDEKGAL